MKGERQVAASGYKKVEVAGFYIRNDEYINVALPSPFSRCKRSEEDDHFRLKFIDN